jgi:hypothetical protein
MAYVVLPKNQYFEIYDEIYDFWVVSKVLYAYVFPDVARGREWS